MPNKQWQEEKEELIMVSGIDGKISVQHTIEMSRQSGDRQNSEAISKEFASKLQKQQDEQNVKSVVKKDETTHGKITDQKKEQENPKKKKKRGLFFKDEEPEVEYSGYLPPTSSLEKSHADIANSLRSGKKIDIQL